MKDTTIILPVYKLDEEDIIMLLNSTQSVDKMKENVKLNIVCPKKLKESVTEELNKNNIEHDIIQNNSSNTDFTYQVNLGIENCDTEWFSILEIDDEYKPNWYNVFLKYRKVYSDVDIFLPIVEDINTEGKFYGFTNESLWAYGFSEKQGFLDKETLLQFQNYQTSGGIFKTQKIKNNGLFKDNIKLTFSYEFLLRMIDVGLIIMSIPKIGYTHVNFRENSLFWKYKNDEKLKMTEKEIKFWIETAKNEYYFKNKRDIVYKE